MTRKMFKKRFVLGIICLGMLASAYAAKTTMQELDNQISKGCGESVVWYLQYAQQSKDAAIAEKAAQAERICDPQKAKEYAAHQEAEKSRAERESAEQKRLANEIVNWRKTLKVGDDSFCGPVIEIRRPLFKIAVRAPQVQQDRGRDAKAVRDQGRVTFLQDRLDAARGFGPKNPLNAPENKASGEEKRADASPLAYGGEAWLKDSEIFPPPPLFGCDNFNGRLSPIKLSQ